MALLMFHLYLPMVDSTKKILLVEDNADLRELLTIAVNYLGYEAIVATTGEEAIELASAKQPDLILMDIGLPKLSGTDATASIKRNRETMHIPIVILTARRAHDETKRALESGAVEVLQKPVSIPEIQEALLKYLSIRVRKSA